MSKPFPTDSGEPAEGLGPLDYPAGPWWTNTAVGHISEELFPKVSAKTGSATYGWEEVAR